MKYHPPQVFYPDYKLHPGYIAWLLHRLTGFGLVLYLSMHIYVIHHIAKGKEAFNQVMALVQMPIFHFLEVALLATVVFHALNGLRVVLIDYGVAGEKEGMHQWVWGVLIATAVLTVVGGIPMILLAFH